MLRNRLTHLVAALALVGLAACDTGDQQTQVEADTTMMTQPGTEEVEVQVPTEDTLMVERRVETEVDVDTTRIEGDPRITGDTVPRP